MLEVLLPMTSVNFAAGPRSQSFTTTKQNYALTLYGKPLNFLYVTIEKLLSYMLPQCTPLAHTHIFFPFLKPNRNTKEKKTLVVFLCVYVGRKGEEDEF